MTINPTYAPIIPALASGLTVVFTCVPDIEGAHWQLVTLGGMLEVDELELDNVVPELASEIRAIARELGEKEARELMESYKEDKRAWRES